LYCFVFLWARWSRRHFPTISATAAFMMRWLLRLLGGCVIVIVSFAGTTFLLNYFVPRCPSGAAYPFKPPFAKAGTGAAYIVPAPSLEALSDSGATPTRSTYVVCENGYSLGPGHTVHVEIGTKGQGRFSHWGPVFIFSASDNSDPNTNGRTYRAIDSR
jgi:hypothetical protein